jgi:hypothetical protein
MPRHILTDELVSVDDLKGFSWLPTTRTPAAGCLLSSMSTSHMHRRYRPLLAHGKFLELQVIRCWKQIADAAGALHSTSSCE